MVWVGSGGFGGIGALGELCCLWWFGIAAYYCLIVFSVYSGLGISICDFWILGFDVGLC